jgi:circadian clock protein KaiC
MDDLTINGEVGDLRVTTGIQGLDSILSGGLPVNRVYLVEGSPGTGKTTLGLQYLLEGIRCGEKVLYIALSETRNELRTVAQSHGWTIDDLDIFELTTREAISPEEQYTLFHPSEVEFGELIQSILNEVRSKQPDRVVLDSLSEMRLLARDPLRYRRQIFALKQFFSSTRGTVLLLDDRVAESDDRVQSIVNGVISLEQSAVAYGSERRRVRIIKMRGVRFRGGYHDLVVRTGGIEVFPRLVAADTRQPFEGAPVASGVPELDDMLGGGLDEGTSTLIMGPAGVGKSVLAFQYALAGAKRGWRSAAYMFDETPNTMRKRCKGLGMDIDRFLAEGLITAEQVDPAELAPGEFVADIQRRVEQEQARIIIIDSLNGYMNAMPEERFLTAQLHEVLTYLGQQGVMTLFVSAQHGILGSAVHDPVEVTYLADSVLLLRYFEAGGRVKKAISVVKKRSGGHQDTIREFSLGPDGVKVGPPLQEFHGILTGIPVFAGASGQLANHSAGITD